MNVNTAVGAAGASFALGLLNARGLNSLSVEVDAMKAAMIEKEEQTPIDPAAAADLADLKTPSQINRDSIADVVTRIQDMEEDVENNKKSISSISKVEDNVKTLSRSIEDLDTEIQNTIFGVETVTSLQPDIENLLEKWTPVSKKLNVSESGNLSIGLTNNNAQESGLYLAGLDNKKWAMYMSNQAGKDTYGKAPPAHGRVTGGAIRFKVDDGANNGLILENFSSKGVFSVDGTGTTTMGSMVAGPLSSDMSGLSRLGKFDATNFAVAQDKNGATRINSSDNRAVHVGNNGVSKMIVEGSDNKTLTLKNNTGTRDTHFNWEGHNIITCQDGKSTLIRVGTQTTAKLDINRNGVQVNGEFRIGSVEVSGVLKKLVATTATLENLRTKYSALEDRVNTIEGKYIDKTVTVQLKNHKNGKYLGEAAFTYGNSYHTNLTISNK